MSIVKKLALIVSLIINVLAEGFDPHRIIGKWYVRSIIHSKPKYTPLFETCITFTFENIERNVYLMRRDLLKRSKPMKDEWTVKFTDDKIFNIPSAPNKSRKTKIKWKNNPPLVIISNELTNNSINTVLASETTVLDLTDGGDLVLYGQETKMYILMSHNEHLSPILMEKYKSYVINGWTMLDIEHMNCQQTIQT